MSKMMTEQIRLPLTPAFSKFYGKAGVEPVAGNDILENIQRELPRLGDPMKMPTQGRCGWTFIFENEVVKAPMEARLHSTNHDLFGISFNQEYKTLQHIDGHGLPVPKVTHVGEKAAFFSMTKLQGEPLAVSSKEFFKSPTPRDSTALATGMAKFIDGLARALSVNDALQKGLIDHGAPAVTPQSLKEALDTDILKSIFGDKAEKLTPILCAYAVALDDKKKIMMHMDLNMGNVLIDQKTGTLSGILDFGYIGQGPAELAISQVLFYSKPFTEKVCSEYNSVAEQKVSFLDVEKVALAHILIIAHSQIRHGYALPEGWHAGVNQRLSSVADDVIASSFPPAAKPKAHDNNLGRTL